LGRAASPPLTAENGLDRCVFSAQCPLQTSLITQPVFRHIQTTVPPLTLHCLLKSVQLSVTSPPSSWAYKRSVNETQQSYYLHLLLLADYMKYRISAASGGSFFVQNAFIPKTTVMIDLFTVGEIRHSSHSSCQVQVG